MTSDDKFGRVISGIALGALVLLLINIWSIHHKEKEVLPKTYKAWVKHTENPNNITYEEWRLLIDLKLDL